MNYYFKNDETSWIRYLYCAITDRLLFEKNYKEYKKEGYALE